MRFMIQNEQIRCEIESHGAELKSLMKKEDVREFMWCADPSYWNRSSPVLFPFVGGVREKKYRHNGKEYSIGQHGFARDMDFSLISQDETEIWFQLTENEESLKNYPYDFLLRIGYRVEASSVKVMWEVENTNEEELWFAIGAHPAFAVDKLNGKSFRLFDGKGQPLSKIRNRVFGAGGCVTDRTEEIPATDGILDISENLFDNDALVLEEYQVRRVELLDEGKNRIVSLDFTAPLVGLWSPPHKNAPFVCIEPWYGRCDSESFAGELKDRDYEQNLAPGKVFRAEYMISI